MFRPRSNAPPLLDWLDYHVHGPARRPWRHPYAFRRHHIARRLLKVLLVVALVVIVAKLLQRRRRSSWL